MMKQIYGDLKAAVKWMAGAFSEPNGKASFGRIACGCVILNIILLGRASLVIPVMWWEMFTWLMVYCFGSKMTPALADHFKTKLTQATNGNGKPEGASALPPTPNAPTAAVATP